MERKTGSIRVMGGGENSPPPFNPNRDDIRPCSIHLPDAEDLQEETWKQNNLDDFKRI